MASETDFLTPRQCHPIPYHAIPKPLAVPVKYNVSLGIFAVHIWRGHMCLRVRRWDGTGGCDRTSSAQRRTLECVQTKQTGKVPLITIPTRSTAHSPPTHFPCRQWLSTAFASLHPCICCKCLPRWPASVDVDVDVDGDVAVDDDDARRLSVWALDEVLARPCRGRNICFGLLVSSF